MLQVEQPRVVRKGRLSSNSDTVYSIPRATTLFVPAPESTTSTIAPHVSYRVEPPCNTTETTSTLIHALTLGIWMGRILDIGMKLLFSLGIVWFIRFVRHRADNTCGARLLTRGK